MFIHYLEIIINNSFVLYELVCKKKNITAVERLEYRRQIVRQMTKPTRISQYIPPSKPKIESSKPKFEEYKVQSTEMEIEPDSHLYTDVE